MQEDQEDLEVIEDRVAERVITYDALLKDLKEHDQIKNSVQEFCCQRTAEIPEE